MARKPNYAYEKNARARAKAAKREAKRQNKLSTRNEDAVTPGRAGDNSTESADTAVERPKQI